MSINLVKNNDKLFHATYPSYLKDSLFQKVFNVAYNVFSVIIFPIGIARLISHKIYQLLGYYLIVPSQFLSRNNKCYLDQGRKYIINKLGGEEIDLVTGDGIEINAMLLRGKTKLGFKLSKNAQLVIHYPGNATRYEDLAYIEDAKCSIQAVRNKGYNVLLFNYRGVGKSGEKTKSIQTTRGLIFDSEAIYEYAIKTLKVNEDKIIAHGHSLGGSMATWIAQSHEKVKLINDRSFSSLEKAIYFIAKKVFQNFASYLIMFPIIFFQKILPKEKALKISHFMIDNKIVVNNRISRPYLLRVIIDIFSVIVAFFISKYTTFLGWDINPYKQWKDVKGKKMVVILKKDGLIPYEASFFKGVKKYPDQFIKIVNPEVYHSTILPGKTFVAAIENFK